MVDRTFEIIIRGKNISGEAFDEAEKDMGGLEDAVKKTSAAIDYAMGQIAVQAFNKLSDAMANSLKSAISASQSYGLQVEDMAREIGTSIEESSRLLQVADDMRVSFSGLSSALKIYSTKQAEVGGVTGISIDQIARLSDAYLALIPGVQRTNFLVDNFGRGGLEMAKLMEQGGVKIREMGSAVEGSLILTDKSIAANEQYRLSIDGLQDAWGGFNIQIGNAMAKNESLNKLIDSLAKTLNVVAEAFMKLPEGAQIGIVAFVGLIALVGKLAPALIGMKVLLGGVGVAAGGAGLGGALASLSGVITGTLLPALASVAVALGTFLISPIGLLVLAIGALVLAWKVFGEEAKKTFGMIVEIIGAALTYRVPEILDRFFLRLGNWERTIAYNTKTWFQDIGKGIVDGLWAGIQGAWDALKANVEGLLTDLLKMVQDALEAHSPSMVWAREVGAPMAWGLQQGFSDAMMRQAGPAMANSFNPAGNSGGGATYKYYQTGHIELNNPLSPGERGWMRRESERIMERSLERILK